MKKIWRTLFFLAAVAVIVLAALEKCGIWRIYIPTPVQNHCAGQICPMDECVVGSVDEIPDGWEELSDEEIVSSL